MRDLFFIVKYGCLALYFFVERHLPEIKDAAVIAGEKAFLAFDFWLTIVIELTSIALLCIKVFSQWLYHTDFTQELIRATIQTVTAPVSSTKTLLNSIKTELVNAWTFRNELILEWA